MDWSSRKARRRTLLSIPGLAAASVLTGDSSSEPPSSFTVMSFNIHHGVGPDGLSNLDDVARAIRRFNPDVVGLQEVDRQFRARSGYQDQVQILSGLTGMPYSAFGANVIDDDSVRLGMAGQYGNAVLSRHKIKESANYHLPLGPGLEQRGLLHTQLLVGDDLVDFYDAHLTAGVGPIRWQQRRREAQEILRVISRLNHPRLLVGDFNAKPSDEEVEMLTSSGIVHDSWRSTFGPGNTQGERRFDLILASHQWNMTRGRVGTSRISDHFPVATSGVMKR